MCLHVWFACLLIDVHPPHVLAFSTVCWVQTRPTGGLSVKMCVQQDLASAFLKQLWACISTTTSPIELQVFHLAQLSAVREVPRYPLTHFLLPFACDLFAMKMLVHTV
ncbi:hypothetical protein V8E53_008839 [Lactarius tabidus]